MIGRAFLAASCYYLWGQYQEYQCLSEYLDRYPPELNETVSKMRKSIDQPLYEYLTDPYCTVKPPKLSREISICGTKTKVATFSWAPNWVAKTSKQSLGMDLTRKMLSDGINGESFLASNEEGGVANGLFWLSRRVSCAHALKKVIKEYHLDRIIIPEKYLCSFPKHSQPWARIPFGHRHVFVLAQKVDTKYSGKNNLSQAINTMSKDAIKDLSAQLNVFLQHCGVLDLRPENVCIIDGKFVLFDTEPFSLCPANSLCSSSTLCAARINLRNLQKLFNNSVNSNIVKKEAETNLKRIRVIEKNQSQISYKCVTLFCLFLLANQLFLSSFF